MNLPSRSRSRTARCRLVLAVLASALLFVFTGAAPAQHAPLPGSGLAIDDVVSGGPAEQAGVRAGDFLVVLGGREIASVDDLDAALDGRSSGETVQITVRRGQERHELSLVLGQESRPGKPSLGIMIAVMGGGGDRSSDRPLEEGEREGLVETIAEALEDGYVIEERGREIASRLRERGEKLSATTTRTFLREMNPLLQELSNDRHLRVTARGAVGGDGPGDRGPGPRRVIRRGPGPGAPGTAGPDAPVESPGDGGSGDRGSGDRGSGDRGPGDQGPRRVVVRSGPEGPAVRAARRLDGNVGLLDLASFPGPEVKEELDRAMLSLEGVEALVIDLRRNGGGQPWTVRYLSGFLFSEPTHLASTAIRGEEPEERWTLDGQPTSAFQKIPVYVLTSSRTFSAAESFTFGLQRLGRVTVVGERTGGGGHFTRDVPLAEDLVLNLPFGRTYDPATGRGWEAEGLRPDIVASSAEALEKALELIARS